MCGSSLSLAQIFNEAEISVRNSQLKKKIAEWKISGKNIRGDTMFEIVRKSVKRKRREGKESTFSVKGNLVASQKIDRFMKRNKLFEEELVSSESPIDGLLYLSLHNDILTLQAAPSPEFTVFTPLPDSLSDIRIQMGHSRGDPMPFQNQYLSSVVSLDLWDLDERPISNDPAYSSYQQSEHCTSEMRNDMSVALTLSQNKSPTLKRDRFFGIVPRCLPNRPESPEKLIMRFRESICPMLSTADGHNNLWDKLVLPLWQNSSSLYNAIAAMGALQRATDSQLRFHGMESLGKSLNTLQPEVLGQTPCIITTLATVLLLAFWTRWDEGLHTGKLHIIGALRLLTEVRSRYREGSLELSTSYSYSLLAFMYDTCSRMDSLSRVVRSAMATDRHEASTLPAFEELHAERSLPGDSLTDPWMGYVRQLFPLISQTADLCNEARSISIDSPAITKKAVSLTLEIEAWIPDKNILYGADNSARDRLHMKHMAKAYRYATLLYLGQVVPGVLANESQDLPQSIIAHLSCVPSDSRMTVVQTYPLFIAGCEAWTKKDRQWVEERWEVMQKRMRLKNLQKCLEITQEVWRRRDAYREERSRNSTYQQPMFDCSGRILEKMDPNFSVGGELHWAWIMKKWGWEVSF